MEKPPTVQLTFQLRTSPNVRSVHLLGSWDNYKRQLPLSMINDNSAKPGSWKGTFRFQGSQALKLGTRYWYYYIVDGYHVSHDPAKEHVTEKTTRQKLNILDIPNPAAKNTKPNPRSGLSLQTQNLQNRPATRYTAEIPRGRGVSPGRIVCPRPQKPYASRNLREADYEISPIDDLEDRFASSRISDRFRRYPSSPSGSDCSSSGPEFSDPGSSASSPSNFNSRECRCGRYALVKDGRRIKMDCGGSRCGYSDGSSSECGSSSSDNESTDERLQARRKFQAAVKRPPQHVTSKRRPVVLERRP